MLLCYHRTMRLTVALAAATLLAAASAKAADPLAEARRLYNARMYDAAMRAAREAERQPAVAESARLVLGRIYLERYRQSAEPADLAAGRETLRTVDARLLDARDRLELTIGLGEALYLEDRFGAAAEMFEYALEASGTLGPAAHERLLDWWATALDRLAQSRPRDARHPYYSRVLARMEKEIAKDPGSSPAAYWLTAAARGCGDVDRAWNAASAGWVRAMLARDRGAALRADLDRLVVQVIIPERAARLQLRDSKPAVAGMLAEWEAFKSSWSR
jgi:hypothetical protein